MFLMKAMNSRLWIAEVRGRGALPSACHLARAWREGGGGGGREGGIDGS